MGRPVTKLNVGIEVPVTKDTPLGVVVPENLEEFQRAFRCSTEAFRKLCFDALKAHPEFLEYRALPKRQECTGDKNVRIPGMQTDNKGRRRLLESKEEGTLRTVTSPTLSAAEYAELTKDQFYARMLYRIMYLAAPDDDANNADDDEVDDGDESFNRAQVHKAYLEYKFQPGDRKWMLAECVSKHICKAWNKDQCWWLAKESNWAWIEKRISKFRREHRLTDNHLPTQAAETATRSLKLSLSARPWDQALSDSIPASLSDLQDLFHQTYFCKAEQDIVQEIHLLDDYDHRLLLDETNYHDLVVQSPQPCLRVSARHRRVTDGDEGEDSNETALWNPHHGTHGPPHVSLSNEALLEGDLDDRLNQAIDYIDTDFPEEVMRTPKSSEDPNFVHGQMSDAGKDDFIDLKSEKERAEPVKRLNGQVDQIAIQTPSSRQYDVGKMLSEFQKACLDFIYKNEMKGHGGVIVDRLSEDMLTLMVAITEYGFLHRDIRAKRLRARGVNEQSPEKPTIIVVSSCLEEKTATEMHNRLGFDWRVFRYGNKKQPGADNARMHVEFVPNNFIFEAFNGAETAGRHAVIISLDELTALYHKAQDLSILSRLFERVIIDEGHELRHCEETMRGQVILAMDVAFVWVLTSRMLFSSFKDIRGYIALLERPRWSQSPDWNAENDQDGRWAAYQGYLEDMAETGKMPTGSSSRGDLRIYKNMPHWHPQAEGIEEMDQNAKMAKLERRDEINWPAMEFWNVSGRRASISASERQSPTPTPADPDPQFDAEKDAPFGGENPYIVFHPDNQNSRRCFTIAATNYWILPHALRVETGRDLKGIHARIVLQRIGFWEDEFVLARSKETYLRYSDGSKYKATPNMKKTRILRVEPVHSADSEKKHRSHMCKTALKELGFDFDASLDHLSSATGNERDEDTAQEDTEKSATPKYNKRIRAIAVLSLLLDHDMFWAFRNRSVEDWVELRNATLTDIVFEMRQANAAYICEQFPEDPYHEPQEVLRQFVSGAPKFRLALRDIRDIVKKSEDDGSDSNKVIVLTQHPQCAEVFQKMMRHIGISSVLLSSATPQAAAERYGQIVKQFNGDAGRYHVLISTFTDLTCVDMHHRCSDIICLDQPANYGVLESAINRIHRPEQAREQRVRRYHISGTHMDAIEERLKGKTRNIAKLLQ